MFNGKRWIAVGTLAALGLWGCGKKSTPADSGGGAPPPKPSAASVEWRGSYGFAGRIPKSAEMYAAWFGLGKEYDAFLKTRFWAALSANPLFKEMRTAAETATPERKAEIANAVATARALFGQEWFVAGGQGGAAGLAWLRDFGDEVRMAPAFAGIGADDPEALVKQQQAALASVLTRRAGELSRAKMTPILIGFRAGADRSLIEAAVRGLEAKLPKETAKAEVEGPEKAKFQSWVFSGKAFLEGPNGETLRGKLQTLLGSDAETSKPILEALAAQTIEVAHGWVGDYLLVSIGADRTALQLAASPDDSILALPENAVGKDFADKRLIAFGWSSKQALEAIQQKIEFVRLLQSFETVGPEWVGAEEWKRLQADAALLDAKGKGLWPVADAAAMFTVAEAGGWRSESYGGLRSPALDASAVAPAWGIPADAILEYTARDNPAFSAAFTAWFETFCSTVFNASKRIALEKMPPEKAAQIAAVDALAVPKILELWGILRDKLGKSLGSGSTFLVDARGPMPSGFPPAMPAGMAGRELLPRLAIISEVRDPALLETAWKELFAWAQGVYALAPKGGGMPPMLPPPSTTDEGNGLRIHQYPLPMDTGDLRPHVARIGKDRVIFGTSPKLSAEIAAAKPAAAEAGNRFVLRLQPLWAAGGRWVDAMGENPEAFFAGKEADQAKFTENRPHLTELFKTLRAVEGIDVRTWDESGRQRQTAWVRFKDL
jgi:hypothetical protein